MLGGTLFGTLPDGQPVRRFELQGQGLRVGILTYAATVQDVRLDGVAHPLVLGYPDLTPYLDEGTYMGALVGRFANRIGNARARIAGRDHQLDRNFRDRHILHGGRDGTGRRNWQVVEAGADHLTLTDTLPDGHMGFPGELTVRVNYRVLDGPALGIQITARTDAETICGFVTHGYWNLDGSGTVAGHVLECAADTRLPVNDDQIPIGDPVPVERRFDWRQPVRIGDRLDAGLIDHNYCLSPRRVPPRPVAKLSAGGLSLIVETTEPGLQLYAGDHLSGGAPGLSGRPHARFAGLALEPQIWPDAPNHEGYPDACLRPGETYRQITTFRFTADEAPP